MARIALRYRRRRPGTRVGYRRLKRRGTMRRTRSRTSLFRRRRSRSKLGYRRKRRLTTFRPKALLPMGDRAIIPLTYGYTTPWTLAPATSTTEITFINVQPGNLASLYNARPTDLQMNAAWKQALPWFRNYRLWHLKIKARVHFFPRQDTWKVEDSVSGEVQGSPWPFYIAMGPLSSGDGPAISTWEDIQNDPKVKKRWVNVGEGLPSTVAMTYKISLPDWYQRTPNQWSNEYRNVGIINDGAVDYSIANPSLGSLATTRPFFFVVGLRRSGRTNEIIVNNGSGNAKICDIDLQVKAVCEMFVNRMDENVIPPIAVS